MAAKLSEATIATNQKFTAKSKTGSAEKGEDFEKFESLEKAEKAKKSKKEKRYISSDEEYDDSEERKKRVSKKAKVFIETKLLDMHLFILFVRIQRKINPAESPAQAQRLTRTPK